MFESILGFIGLVAGIGGLIGGFFAGQERSSALDRMAEARNRANEIERRKQSLSSRRLKLQTIREARIKRATAVSRATAQGASGSVRGAFGSIQSQAGGNFVFQNAFTGLVAKQNMFLSQSSIFGLEARKAGEMQNLFGAFAGFGGTIFSNRKDIASIFP
jgi:hypothetical protein